MFRCNAFLILIFDLFRTFSIAYQVIGLTGGIASGKSTVSTLLKSYQIPIIDLDLLAREVVKPGSSALRSIEKHFSQEINLIDSNTGELNRTKLGDIIFSDPIQRKWIDSLLHPRIKRLMLYQIVKLWITGHKVCVIDSPLLIETGMWKFCGKIIVVYCSEQIQLKRLMSRNSIDEKIAKQKMKSQLPLKSKLLYSDYILENSGNLNELESQVERLVWKLERDHSKLLWLLNWLILPFGLLNGLIYITWRLWFKGIGRHKSNSNRFRNSTSSSSNSSHE
ncbi:hypothetical protein CROQUDRAFT_44847 [Cronartium quercuum f. sp. fusiforme G11]|uniref:Dephospho-CoA kinase n=1 Tax=Cronartium quercuum f. sp. fusiforme G11 TaxID=708437 RepID=A0A9P6TBX2_9BASI|nr:hypothetical protein CROQUDRAFT_44847 [Cronartium quercuum f. sp. fusiforme G11]